MAAGASVQTLSVKATLDMSKYDICGDVTDTMHSGPNQGFLSNGYIIKYFLKFLKNIFMLTKIFEETLTWLVKILKTDQQ